MTLKKKTTTELQSGNWMEVEDSKVINNATGKVAIVSQEKMVEFK